MSFFLKQLRGPLILVIAIYAVGIGGLVLIPGVDAQGRPTAPMSFFHAFYFLSYTATTIGFGELPNPFSDTQRLWVSFIIYLSVVGWTYLIARLIALMQDRAIIDAMHTERVRRSTSRHRIPARAAGRTPIGRWTRRVSCCWNCSGRPAERVAP